MTGWSSKPEWPSVEQLSPALSRGNYLNKADWEAGVKEYNNLKPTHDPYTNPDTQVYYECKCGAILDPGTKSFASLNNAASDKGWKVRWKQNGEGYEPFCEECGKDVE